MPIYEYECPEHGVWELLSPHVFVPIEQDIRCPECGRISRRIVSAPARTPGRWGYTNAYDDPVLGHVKNSMDYERKLKERNLVPVEDVREQTTRNIRHQQEEYNKSKRLREKIDQIESETNAPIDGETLLKLTEE